MKLLPLWRNYDVRCCAGSNATSRSCRTLTNGEEDAWTWSKSTSTIGAGSRECPTTAAGPGRTWSATRGSCAWLLAQHAERDPIFRRRCLDLLSTALAGGQASHLAYLTDRVQLKELGYQTYGTQYQAAAGTWGLQTVNERESPEERRLSVRLPHSRPAPVYGGNLRPAPSTGLATASSGPLPGL